MAVATIYKDIYVQCSTFSKCDFSFYNREANSVVDALSRETDSTLNILVDEPLGFFSF
jgi:hypothetical protein